MDVEEYFDRLYSHFCVPFPCYALSAHSGEGVVTEQAADGTEAVVILTDDDMLRRFHAERQAAPHFPVVLSEPRELARFLARLPSRITHVTFDPLPRVHRRYPREVIRASVSRAVSRS